MAEVIVYYPERNGERDPAYIEGGIVGELVRCKDCKYGVKPLTLSSYPNVTWCNQYSTSHNDEWFCADGKKRDNND